MLTEYKPPAELTLQSTYAEISNRGFPECNTSFLAAVNSIGYMSEKPKTNS